MRFSSERGVAGSHPREIHHIVTAEEAVRLVLEHAGVAFMAKTVAISNQQSGVVMKPLAEERLLVKDLSRATCQRILAHGEGICACLPA